MCNFGVNLIFIICSIVLIILSVVSFCLGKELTGTLIAIAALICLIFLCFSKILRFGDPAKTIAWETKKIEKCVDEIIVVENNKNIANQIKRQKLINQLLDHEAEIGIVLKLQNEHTYKKTLLEVMLQQCKDIPELERILNDYAEEIKKEQDIAKDL